MFCKKILPALETPQSSFSIFPSTENTGIAKMFEDKIQEALKNQLYSINNKNSDLHKQNQDFQKHVLNICQGSNNTINSNNKTFVQGCDFRERTHLFTQQRANGKFFAPRSFINQTTLDISTFWRHLSRGRNCIARTIARFRLNTESTSFLGGGSPFPVGRFSEKRSFWIKRNTVVELWPVFLRGFHQNCQRTNRQAHRTEHFIRGGIKRIQLFPP